MPDNPLRDLTLQDLLTRLPITQLWALGGTILLVLGVTFGLGTKLGPAAPSAEAAATISALQTNVGTLTTQNQTLTAELAKQKFKNVFFSTYLRYVVLLNPDFEVPGIPLEQRRADAKAEFVKLVKDIWDRREQLANVNFDKGANEEVGVVSFVGENVGWQIPLEIKREAHIQGAHP